MELWWWWWRLLWRSRLWQWQQARRRGRGLVRREQREQGRNALHQLGHGEVWGGPVGVFGRVHVWEWGCRHQLLPDRHAIRGYSARVFVVSSGPVLVHNWGHRMQPVSGGDIQSRDRLFHLHPMPGGNVFIEGWPYQRFFLHFVFRWKIQQRYGHAGRQCMHSVWRRDVHGL